MGACVSNTVNCMWKALFANLCPGLIAAPERTKFKFIQNSLMSLATWKWARWPFTKTIAARLDSVQSHFVQYLFPLKKRDDETVDAYFVRVRLQAGRLSSKMGRWSGYWAGALKGWDSHMKNANLDESWIAQLNTFQGLSFLEARRMHFSRGSQRDRTATRAVQGHVHVRWHDGLEAARNITSLNPALPSSSRFFGA